MVSAHGRQAAAQRTAGILSPESWFWERKSCELLYLHAQHTVLTACEIQPRETVWISPGAVPAPEAVIKPLNKTTVEWFPHGKGKSFPDYYPISGFPLAAGGPERPCEGRALFPGLPSPKQIMKVLQRTEPNLWSASVISLTILGKLL